MKRKVLISILICLFCISLCGCGSSSSSDGASSETDVTESGDMNTAEEEPEVIKLEIGDTIETDSIKMTIDSVEIVDKYPLPDLDTTYVPSAGYKMLLVKGAFVNKTDADISNASFNVLTTVNEEPTDCKLFFENDDQWTAPASSEMNYFIPGKVSEHQFEQYDTATITIGFRDDMSAITPDYTDDVTNVYEIEYKYK